MHEITWKKLCQAPHALRMPFELHLPGEAEPLICESLVRVLPRKRLVLFGSWQAQPVVIKLFLESGRAQHHLQREAQGLKILTESGIPTPELLYEGQTTRYHVPVLVMRRIMGAKDLATLWENRVHPETAGRLMHAVIIELATQHVMGIVQRDMHLANFLVKGHHIYSLDGGNMEFFHEPLIRKSSLEHLALFFAQLGVGTEKLRYALYALYAKARGWQMKRADIVFLERATRIGLRERMRRFSEKVLRNSTQFRALHYFNSHMYFDRKYQTSNFMRFLANPEAVFDATDTHILKKGNSTTVAKIKLDDRWFVVKRYNMKNFRHWLRRCLRVTRAVKCWQRAHMLRVAGIATAKPVACIEKRFFGLRGRSYFVMEHVEGIDLEHYFDAYDSTEPRFARLAARVTTLLKNLSELRLSHGDLKASNFLIENEKPMLIDLDGMWQQRALHRSKRAARREIERFMQNWICKPEVAQLFERFL